MAKVRFQDSSGGEFDGNAPALDMDYSEATGKYLRVEYLTESKCYVPTLGTYDTSATTAWYKPNPKES